MGDAHAFRRDTTVPDPNIEVFNVEIVFLMLMDWLMPLELCSVRTGSYQNHGLGGALFDGVGLPLWRLGRARGPGNPASMHMLILRSGVAVVRVRVQDEDDDLPIE